MQSKTAFIKAIHFSKSGNDSSEAIKSYFENLYHISDLRSDIGKFCVTGPCQTKRKERADTDVRF